MRDVHLRCPVAISGLSSHPGVLGARWVRAVVDAWKWTETGSPLHEYEPRPTPALLDGVLLLRQEFGLVEAARIRDAAPKPGQGVGGG